MMLKNKVQLITYPDSLGRNLQQLQEVLEVYFPDVFQGGLHILPPFPSSGDRGFAPLTYLEIDPNFGTWSDINRLAEQYDVLLDLMVNHISKESSFFQNYLKEGNDSEYADIFLNLYKIWKNGIPVQKDIDKIFLRRELPYSEFTIEKTGKKEKVWTTFGKQNPSEQIDFDINAVKTKELLTRFMLNFKDQNVKIVRLDAVGYVVKKMGTSCFFVEPEIYDFLNWIANLAQKLNIVLLPEVHSHYSIQYKLAEKGFWIYDFILPYVVLETLENRNSTRLYNYLKTRPEKQFTMLDCHDGIPVKPDLDELVSTTDAQKIMDICLQRGGNLSKVYSEKHKSSDGFDVHQIRITYYDALNANDDAYLVARAIQFFVPGIPQVYYVGLLAGKNDMENVLKTGEGREINRHNYSIEEIENAVKTDVVKRLVKLIRFRNNHDSFNGQFEALYVEEQKIILQWTNGATKSVLNVDLNNYKSQIVYTDLNNTEQIYTV